MSHEMIDEIQSRKGEKVALFLTFENAAGLILGVLEGLLPLAMPNTWVPVIEFLLFLLILMVKPSGLLGGRK